MREVNYYKGFYSPNPNDRRGELFTYRSIDYDKIVEGFKSGKGLSVAECKYYEPNVKTDPRVRDQDINQEYIKFIVDVARWHRYIDKKSGMGVTMDNIYGSNAPITTAANAVIANMVAGNNVTVAGTNQASDIGDTIPNHGLNFPAAVPAVQTPSSNYLKPIMVIARELYDVAGNLGAQAVLNKVNFPTFMTTIRPFLMTEITSIVDNAFGTVIDGHAIMATLQAQDHNLYRDIRQSVLDKMYSYYITIAQSMVDQLSTEIKAIGPPITPVAYLTALSNTGASTGNVKSIFVEYNTGAKNATYITDVTQTFINAVLSAYRNSRFYVRTALGDLEIWKWFKNTLRNFNSFPQNVKRFYNSFMGIMKAGDGKLYNIEEKVDEINDQNAIDYRINLKKTITGDVVFSNALPLLPAGGANIWIYANTRITVAEQEVFKCIYSQIYGNNPSVEPRQIIDIANNNIVGLSLSHPVITFDTTETYFNFDLDGLFKSILKEAIQAPIGSDVDDFPEDTIEVDNQFTGRAYYKGGILMWKDGDEEKKVEDYDYLTKRHKCFSTQLGINEEECTNYIFKCVFSTKDDNYTDCEAVFSRRDIFPKDISVFNNAHPYIMFRTVQKLKFLAKKEIVDKIVLNKLESLDDWIKRHKADTNSAVHTLAITIEGNVDAQNYLKNLVSYINGNPEIINKNYKKKEGSLGKVNPEDPYGLSYPRRLITDMSLQQLGTIINNTNKNLFVKNSPLGLMMGPYLFNGMVGGSQMFTVDNTPRGWKALSNTLAVYRRKLVTYNKSLSPNTERKLKAKIEDVKKYEESTAKYINYIKQYNEIIEKLGDYTQNTSLSMAELMEVVNNNYNKLIEKKSRKEGQIISAIDALRDAVISEGKKAGDSDPLGAIQHTPITLDSLDPLVK
jgi:hypothetical protein